MIVTASFGLEPGRRVEYIPLVEKALELSSHQPAHVLIYNRPHMVSPPGSVVCRCTSWNLMFALIVSCP
jgi:hypothetical protein